MSMTKPTNNAMPAFNATSDMEFSFVSSGGNIPVNNRLVISTNAIPSVEVYNVKTTSTDNVALLKQTVTANTLVNGTQYNFYFIAYDVDDNASPASTVTTFWCYTSPTITFTNIPTTNIINASSYNFTATYNQIQGELLSELIFYLYNEDGKQIDKSDSIFSTLTPPISVNWTFDGFEDNKSYSIKIVATSVNNTETSSSTVTFTTDVYVPNLVSLIELENDCNNGYIRITSNIIIADGISYPSTPKYLIRTVEGSSELYWETAYTTNGITPLSNYEIYAVDLRGNTVLNYIENNTLYWETSYTTDGVTPLATYEPNAIRYSNMNKTLTYNDGFSIPSSFQFVMFGSTSMEGEICRMYKTAITPISLIISMRSGIPSGETKIKNWIEIESEDGNLFYYTNYIDALTEYDEWELFLNKVNNTYTFTIEKVDTRVGSNIHWLGESTYPSSTITNDISSLFPFDTVIFKNGAIDHMDFNRNTSRVYSTSYPIWDVYTIMDSNFNGTVSASNIDTTLSQIDTLRVKRRLSGGFDWITIYEKSITKADDLYINIRDAITPTFESYDYAIVPVLAEVEGDYIISSVNASFRWCYLCDNSTNIVFQSGVTQSFTPSVLGGINIPLARKYPIVINNSEQDYDMGTFTGYVLPEDFIENRAMDRKEATIYSKKLRAFLTNKKPKALKDWNGNIHIVMTQVSSASTITPDLITGLYSATFTWVEVGAYDDENSLRENGLLG